MPDQDYLAGSILQSPLQVGATVGIPQSSPLQQAVQQANPQQLYNGGAELGGMVNPTTVHQAFDPSEQVKKISQIRINDANDRINQRQLAAMADKQYAKDHPHLYALSNVLKSTNMGATFLKSTAKQEALNYKMKEALDNQDFQDILDATEASRNTNPKMLSFALGAMKDKMAAGKDMQEGLNSEGQPELRKAQAYQAMEAGNYSKAEALGLPIKNQNEADRNTIDANKALIDYTQKAQEFQRNQNQDTYKAVQDSYANYLKVMDTNTKRAEINEKTAQAAHEQIPSADKTGMVPKYSGYNRGTPLNMLQVPPPPNTGGPAYSMDNPNPQAQAALRQLSNISTRPQIQGKPGQLVPPPPPSAPPPSLVGPQTPPARPGGAITPTQAASQGILPPPAAGTQGPQQQPQIKDSDVPVPISAQMAYMSLPPGFRSQGEAMIATFRGRVAAGWPEAKELASMVQAMNKLSGKKQ